MPEVYIETDGTTREQKIVLKMPGSDTESLSYFQPVEVSEWTYDRLVTATTEENKQITKDILQSKSENKLKPMIDSVRSNKEYLKTKQK